LETTVTPMGYRAVSCDLVQRRLVARHEHEVEAILCEQPRQLSAYTA
jgi:hypothetical protein